MAVIQDLPLELIQQLLLELDPLDVANVSQTCTTYAALVYDPHGISFWRELYLRQPFDDPRTCYTELGDPVGPPIDWKTRLKRIIRARTVVNDPSKCRIDERRQVYQTLLDMVREIPPTNSDAEQSLNAAYVVSLLDGREFLDLESCWTEPLDREERQIRARIHTYFGLTAKDLQQPRRTEARGQVYAMRNYKPLNFYGPFLKDGSARVDWEMMSHIHLVMSIHVVPPIIYDGFRYIIYPMCLPYCQSEIPRGIDLDKEVDWAGITGTWKCSFCFIDHRELLVFNNYNLSDQIRLDTSLFDDPNFIEIFRTINVKFHVKDSEPDPNHPTRPKLHFDGEIEGHAHMFGWVAITPDDNLRWHFESGEPGNPVWSSEGVQVGGVRSLYGVLGVWTSVEHDINDPVGPFWLRKVLEPGDSGAAFEASANR
ncbi:unnamed protein product [Somion occarium]|uniref:F-box domain-containing protein n=2 Tax=Somion occarium TaxID=3059160 RepID=A0ABP1DWK4_9APHY